MAACVDAKAAFSCVEAALLLHAVVVAAKFAFASADAAADGDAVADGGNAQA